MELKMSLTNIIIKWICVVLTSIIFLLFLAPFRIAWFGEDLLSIINILINLGILLFIVFTIVDLFKMKFWAVIVLSLVSVYIIYSTIASPDFLTLLISAVLIIVNIYFWSNKKYFR